MIEIDIHLESMANLREHFGARQRRAKSHREIVGWALKTTKKPALPVTVRLTRIGPRVWDDDNNVGGLKNCRDAVADWLGVNDGDRTQIRFEYEQETGTNFPRRLRIEFL
jgi:hypothetical protein